MALISEKQRLQNQYQHEFDYVQKKYEAQDIDPQLAKQATKELMEKDALGTAVQERYGFNPNEAHMLRRLLLLYLFQPVQFYRWWRLPFPLQMFES